MILIGIWVGFSALSRWWSPSSFLQSKEVTMSAVQRAPQSVQNIKTSSAVCNPASPQAYLYRYGSKNELHKMTDAAGLKPDLWQKWARGNSNRFQLKPFRRGLFVSESPEDIESFATPNFDELIRIELRFECLFGTQTAHLMGLPLNERFTDWFQKAHPERSLAIWANGCFDPDGAPNSNQFNFYKTATESETDCEQIVEQYFQENQIRIVRDHLGTRSWLIRDQACVREFRGGAALWSTELFKNPLFWKNSCDEYRDHRLMTKIFFFSIRDGLVAFPDGLSFQTVLQGLRAPSDVMARSFSAQDFAASFDDAMVRCQGKQDLGMFRASIGRIGEQLNADVDLTSSGVKAKIEAICR